MMRLTHGLMSILWAIFLVMLFANLLTSRPYIQLSKGLYETHDLIEYDHDYVARQLIDYLNYRHDDLHFGADANDDTVLMRDIEIRHMVDVKNLYTSLRIVAILALVIVIGFSVWLFQKDINSFYQMVKNSYQIPLAFAVFVGVWFMIDFNRIFTLFHELFFDNDDWLLRSDDVLILLLPQMFWFVSGALILFGLVMSIGLTIYINQIKIKPKVSQ